MKKAIWLVVIVAIIAALLMGYRYTKRADHVATTFESVTVVRGKIDAVILSTGLVGPQNRLEIKPPLAGRVDDVLVDEGDTIVKGQTIAWMSSSERAALIDAATARGKKELKEWEELYKKTPILAPISGTIIKRNIEPGQTFTISDAILVMSDRLTVKAQVDETDIAKVRLKQRCRIVLDAYADQSIEGYVDQIAYDATTVNNVTTYVVDVTPDRTPAFMRSGMTANVTFSVESKKNVLMVPTSAIKTRGGESFVLLPPKEEGEEPSEQSVTLGISDGKHTEVFSGLQEGDVIWLATFNAKDPKSSSSSPLSPFRPPPPKRR